MATIRSTSLSQLKVQLRTITNAISIRPSMSTA